MDNYSVKHKNFKKNVTFQRMVENFSLRKLERTMSELDKLTWLKYYRVAGCPDDVIRVEFRVPDFINPAIIKESVLVRIDSVENRKFHCTVVSNPKKDWKLRKGDRVLVEYYYFENAHHLVCRTLEDLFGFEWIR